MLARLPRLLTVGVLAGVLAAGSSLAAQEPTLSKEQMRQFLLTAEIVDSAPIGTGVTRPWRRTLSDGTITHRSESGENSEVQKALRSATVSCSRG